MPSFRPVPEARSDGVHGNDVVDAQADRAAPGFHVDHVRGLGFRQFAVKSLPVGQFDGLPRRADDLFDVVPFDKNRTHVISAEFQYSPVQPLDFPGDPVAVFQENDISLVGPGRQAEQEQETKEEWFRSDGDHENT